LKISYHVYRSKHDSLFYGMSGKTLTYVLC